MDGALCIYVFNLYHLTLFGMPSLLLYAFFTVVHGILVHHDYCSPVDLVFYLSDAWFLLQPMSS